MSKWYVTAGDVLAASTTVCDIDIPEQFCFGMEVEESGFVVSVEKGEGEECVGGDVICVIDDGKDSEESNSDDNK